MSALFRKKVSGVLLPLSALPGPYGIGDLGPQAYRYIDWLHRAGQRHWQVLPLTIPDSTGSPYASLSGEAGNWLLISPERLQQENLLPSKYRSQKVAGKSVAYRLVMKTKWQLVRASHQFFVINATSKQRRDFDHFRLTQASWLDTYILFQALKDRHQQRPWWTWEPKWRKPHLAKRHLDDHLRHQMELHAYAQWLWSEQWDAVHMYAKRRGVKIIGDLPFFVRTDSVDVWAHPSLFLLNRRGLPTVVAGVQPDYFSKDGQLWGNPQYNWRHHSRTDFAWWIARVKLLHHRCDIIRLDHFRGLNHTWHVPVWATTAKRGWWVTTPGKQLLRSIKKHVPHLDLIAEDLGSEPVGADSLRRQFHIPTIRVMIFGSNGLSDNPHNLNNIQSDAVYYTSIHDTNTVAGWWRDEAEAHEREALRQHLKKIKNISEQCIELVWSTPATTVLAAMQDVLGLGSSARFNRPGKQRGNWAWRMNDKHLDFASARRLARITKKYGRT